MNEYLSRSTDDKAEKATPDFRSIAINTFFVPTSWGRDPPAQRAGPDLRLRVGSTTSTTHLPTFNLIHLLDSNLDCKVRPFRFRLYFLVVARAKTRLPRAACPRARDTSILSFSSHSTFRTSPGSNQGPRQGPCSVFRVPCFAVIISGAVSLYGLQERVICCARIGVSHGRMRWSRSPSWCQLIF